VQVDPFNPNLKPPVIKRFETKIWSSAFKFRLQFQLAPVQRGVDVIRECLRQLLPEPQGAPAVRAHHGVAVPVDLRGVLCRHALRRLRIRARGPHLVDHVHHVHKGDGQGLTLVHLSAQSKRFLWDMGRV